MPCRRAISSPSRRERATQSATVAPRMGMSGTTSTAPIRGCSPRCVRRSIRGTAASNSARTAATTDSPSPTNVRTLRLWDASEETERRRTPGTLRTAVASSSTRARSRPSETLGTHSITGRIGKFRRAVYNREAGEPPNNPESSMSSTNPASYPGNPSLPREVRDKILSTFRHTLNLFGQGKLDDCVIGCDFILKMDPRFAPARRLMDKARNPAADVDVAELESLVATTPTRQERVVAAEPDRLLVRAVESFNARDFDAAMAAANQVLAVLPGNQDALEILEQAKTKKAAQPVFDASRQRAIAALEGLRSDEANRELQKMRELDPDHPAVALLERRLQQMPAPQAPAAPIPPPA